MHSTCAQNVLNELTSHPEPAGRIPTYPPDPTRAHCNLLMARLRLEAEAGELDEDDLTAVNNMLR
jgi:hypothetical protein